MCIRFLLKWFDIIDLKLPKAVLLELHYFINSLLFHENKLGI